ncbi:hypothetical protein RB595_009622 [Gaeumannomyces hyphopodioides]
MDILKVLSRGTKLQSKRPGGSAAPARADLPSAGVETNPQLYHDDVGPVPAPKGTKRKRKSREKGDDRRAQEEVGGETEEDEDQLSDIDFFAPKNRPGQGGDAASGKSAKDGDDKKKKKQKKGDSDASTVEPLELDECKRIMRSHRLKFTLLRLQQPEKESASRLEAEEDAKKKKKKRKKLGKGEEEAAAAPPQSDEKKQICPQPLVSFSELRRTYRISPRLADNLARDGYKVPTEVQLGSLPLLLRPEFALGRCESAAGEGDGRGVHFLAVAPTGSGKTLSFLIPAINGVLKRRAERGSGDGDGGDRHALEAIVVAPTRELASQIANEGRKLAAGTGVRVVLMRKGMRVAATAGGGSVAQGASADGEDLFESEAESSSGDEDEQQDESGSRLKKAAAAARNPTKADVLVTTPMLLLNFLSEGGSSKTLPDVRSLILDEADVLLDPLFRDQTVGIWSACHNPELRVTFWSATMPSSIEALMFDRLGAHHSNSNGNSSTAAPPLVRLVVGLKDTAVPNISHRLTYTATEAGKLLAIRQLLHPSSFTSSSSSPADAPLRPPFLVFTQTVERAAALHDELRYDIPAAAGGAARLAVLHSSLPDSTRAAVVRRFRAGDVWVLITTDVLARGVDFAGVNGVVNYDVPGSAAAYVHRAGRTGRAGRRGGVAVTFYTKEDIPFVKSVANVIALSEKQAAAAGSGAVGTQKWLLDALPDVSKKDRKTLREKGVESRRAGAAKARITSKSTWERRRENNRRGAIEGSKKRKKALLGNDAGGTSARHDDGDEWGGIDD